MRRIITVLTTVLAFMIAFAGTAFATGAIESTDSGALLDMARPVFQAVMSGQWAAGAALALVLLVGLARKYGTKRFPALATDAGGTALTLVGSFGGALATALLAGSAPSLGLAYTALGIAVAASGGYTMIKRLGLPLLRALAGYLPAAFRTPVLALLEMIAKMLGASAIPKAEAAGEAAVKANPPNGAEGVIGKAREIR